MARMEPYSDGYGLRPFLSRAVSDIPSFVRDCIIFIRRARSKPRQIRAATPEC